MKETFALINDKDQVVNHIVIDKDDANFESNMADQLTLWSCVRYVETDTDTVIILDESPEIWTTHTEADGFVIPTTEAPIDEPVVVTNQAETWDGTKVTINGLEYPSNSLLIKENASLRPAGWKLGEGVEEVSLADAE